MRCQVIIELLDRVSDPAVRRTDAMERCHRAKRVIRLIQQHFEVMPRLNVLLVPIPLKNIRCVVGTLRDRIAGGYPRQHQ